MLAVDLAEEVIIFLGLVGNRFHDPFLLVVGVVVLVAEHAQTVYVESVF